MPAEGKAQVEGIDTQAVKVPLKRAPTLYLIIAFKLAKGLLAAFLAFTLYFQPAKKLQPEYEEIIGSPVVKRVFYYLRIHPENKFFQHVTTLIDNASDVTVHHAAVGLLLWSLFPTVEGVGLLFRVPWAGWLAIFESAFFVPLEVNDLLKKFSWFMVVVTVTNIFIVWYLYAYRDRLFRHHHRG